MDYRLNKIINIIRNLNEEMVGNAVGQSGGFGSASPATGPTAGFDPVMRGKMHRRNKKTVKQIKEQIIGKGKYPGARKRWGLKRKNEKI